MSSLLRGIKISSLPPSAVSHSKDNLDSPSFDRHTSSKKKKSKRKSKKHKKHRKRDSSSDSGSDSSNDNSDDDQLHQKRKRGINTHGYSSDSSSNSDNSYANGNSRALMTNNSRNNREIDTLSTNSSERYDKSTSDVQELDNKPKSNQSVAQMLREKLMQKKTVITDDINPAVSNNSVLDSEFAFKAAQAQRLKTKMSELNDNDIKSFIINQKLQRQDMDQVLTANILRQGDRYKGKEFGLKDGDRPGIDDEDQEVDTSSMFGGNSDYLSDPKAIQRNIQRTLNDQKHYLHAVERCRYCMESKNHVNSLDIAIGDNAILAMKPSQSSLVENHMEIIPIQHQCSILQCDENVQVEIERIKASLRRMYEKQNKNVLFIESAVCFHKKPHAVIDVIPVVKGMENDAKLFFSEAFNSLQDDNRVSNNKQAIIYYSNNNRDGKKPIHRVVPRHYQYLLYEHEECNGLAFLIEDQKNVTNNFCLEVIEGMLDDPDVQIYNKSHQPLTGINQSDHDRVREFKSMYTKYDWTTSNK